MLDFIRGGYFLTQETVEKLNIGNFNKEFINKFGDNYIIEVKYRSLMDIHQHCFNSGIHVEYKILEYILSGKLHIKRYECLVEII